MAIRFTAGISAMIMVSVLLVGCGESVEVNRAEEVVQSEAETGETDEASAEEAETEADEVCDVMEETVSEEEVKQQELKLLTKITNTGADGKTEYREEYTYDTYGNLIKTACLERWAVLVDFVFLKYLTLA